MTIDPFAKPRVIHADAADALPTLPRDSIDLVLTSPPYWGMRSYAIEHDEAVLDRWVEYGGDLDTAPPWRWYRDHGGALGREPNPEWYVEHLAELLDGARGVLRQTGNMWVNVGDTYFSRWSSVREQGRQGLAQGPRARRRAPSGGIRHDKQLLLLPSRLAIAMQGRGWVLRNDVIWSKPNPTPQPCRDRLALAHEHLFHFVQRRPSGRPRYFYDAAHVESGARDVVTAPTGSPRDGRTAGFPEALIAPRIASSCPPGGVVLDPFCGSGAALEVAARLGRRAVGIELCAERAEGARDRLVQDARSRSVTRAA